MKRNRGTLYVFSGPSGVGKGTVLGRVMERRDNIWPSVSATTRSPREGESEGKAYFFKDRGEFEQMAEDGEFLEWAEYAGNLYGTPRAEVEKHLADGDDVVLEIDVQGALQVRESMPECVLVFVAPPSIDELEARLRGRGTEDDDIIDQRLAAAKIELDAKKEYDIVFVNDDIDDTVSEIIDFMDSGSVHTASAEPDESERRS